MASNTFAAANPPPVPPSEDADFLLAQRLQKEEDEAYFREQREFSGLENAPRSSDDGDVDMNDSDHSMPGSFVDDRASDYAQSLPDRGETGSTPPQVDARTWEQRHFGERRRQEPEMTQRRGWEAPNHSPRIGGSTSSGGRAEHEPSTRSTAPTQQQLDELMARQLQDEENGEDHTSLFSSSPPRRPPPLRPLMDPRSLLLSSMLGGSSSMAPFGDPFFVNGMQSPGRRRRFNDPTDPFNLFHPLGGGSGINIRFGGGEDFTVTRDNFDTWRSGLGPLLAGRFGEELGGSMVGEVPMSYEEMLALAERIGPAVPRGATAEQLASLPTTKYTPPSKPSTSLSTSEGLGSSSSSSTITDPSYSKCSICMEDFTAGAELVVLPRCLHRFHSECVVTWLKTNATCPICRVGVNVEDSEAGETAPGNPSGRSRAGEATQFQAGEDSDSNPGMVRSLSNWIWGGSRDS
ncbi:RING finger protein 44 [Gonapodya sp. JEL0774]|nr:RING finger protein 44 [Gonapodya sp. JEL0774]